jgi:glyoxylase-like metal-dependent hydrolase (beta-lactamase superfamily II)
MKTSPTLLVSMLASILCFISSTQVVLAEVDRFAKVEIQTIAVRGGVSMLTGSGGNIGVSSGPDGLLIIDDQYAPLSEKISVALDKLAGDQPQFIINTHFHGDHTGGNVHFSESGTVIAHDNVRARLETNSEAPEALPVITYEKEMKIYFNGEEIRVIHLPEGHTDGDSIVLFTSSNVAHLGDQFWNGLFPFIDLDSGGTVEGYILNVSESLEWVDSDTVIIPGHGKLATKKELEGFYNMLTETSGLVRKLMTEGLSLDEIVARGLGEEWVSWGEWFIKEDTWIRTLHKSFMMQDTASSESE